MAAGEATADAKSATTTAAHQISKNISIGFRLCPFLFLLRRMQAWRICRQRARRPFCSGIPSAPMSARDKLAAEFRQRLSSLEKSYRSRQRSACQERRVDVPG